MTTVTVHQAIQDLSSRFKIGTGLSFMRDNRFYICKWEYTREEVRKILTDYFSTRVLEEGWRLVLYPVEYIFSEFYLTQEQ